MTQSPMTAIESAKPVSSWRTSSPIDRLLFRVRRWIVAVLVPLWIAAVIASSPARMPGQSLTLLFVVIAVLPRR